MANYEVGDYLDPTSTVVEDGNVSGNESWIWGTFPVNSRTVVNLPTGETAIVNEDGIIEDIR